jgi:hypothetical protein
VETEPPRPVVSGAEFEARVAEKMGSSAPAFMRPTFEALVAAEVDRAEDAAEDTQLQLAWEAARTGPVPEVTQLEVFDEGAALAEGAKLDLSPGALRSFVALRLQAYERRQWERAKVRKERVVDEVTGKARTGNVVTVEVPAIRNLKDKRLLALPAWVMRVLEDLHARVRQRHRDAERVVRVLLGTIADTIHEPVAAVKAALYYLDRVGLIRVKTPPQQYRKQGGTMGWTAGEYTVPPLPALDAGAVAAAIEEARRGGFSKDPAGRERKRKLRQTTGTDVRPGCADGLSVDSQDP